MLTRHPEDTGRLHVKLISKRALRDYMAFRGETNASLAEKARVSPSLIALLRTDSKSGRQTCRAENARAIEEALNAPPGSLFAAKVIAVSPYVGRKSA